MAVWSRSDVGGVWVLAFVQRYERAARSSIAPVSTSQRMALERDPNPDRLIGKRLIVSFRVSSKYELSRSGEVEKQSRH